MSVVVRAAGVTEAAIMVYIVSSLVFSLLLRWNHVLKIFFEDVKLMFSLNILAPSYRVIYLEVSLFMVNNYFLESINI